MTSAQKRAIIVRQIDNRRKKLDDAIEGMKEYPLESARYAMRCWNVAACAHNLAMKADELARIDAEQDGK